MSWSKDLLRQNDKENRYYGLHFKNVVNSKINYKN